jgi:O-antigen biosynthesis protein
MSIPKEQSKDSFRSWVHVSTDDGAKVRHLSADGWVFSFRDGKIEGIRAIAYGRTWPGQYGLPRPDVALAFPSEKQALKSGFRISLPSLDPPGRLCLEVRMAGKWQTFFISDDAPRARMSGLDYAQARLRNLFERSTGRPPARYEGLEQGYICWIDQPLDWRRVSSRFRVSGWCFSRDGKLIEGIRACIGSQCFAGQYGLSRPDVVAFYRDRPRALKSGFEVAVDAPRKEVSLFRLEARHANGLWKEIFRKPIRVSLLNRAKLAVGTDYQTWINRYDTLRLGDRSRIRRHFRTFKQYPRFAILMNLSEPDPEYLAASLRSVREQIYPHWELCVVSSGPSAEKVRRVLSRYARLDNRIMLCDERDRGGVAVAGDEVLGSAQGDFVTFLHAHDRLASTALYFVAREINGHPEAQLIYTDEDKLDAAGRRVEPHFKPDWNQQLLLERNYVSDLCVFRGDLIKSSGFRPGFEGSASYNLLLRCTGKITTSQIRHIPRVLYHRRTPAKTFASDSATRAVQEHLEQQGIAAELISHGGRDHRRVRYLIPKVRPSVSIIIPTRDMIHLLRPCLESILEKTTYSPFEIVVVDNGSREAAALDYLAQVSREPRVRLLRRHEEFNYSRLINCGVQNSESEFVALVNNDVMVISPDWVEEMVSQAIQPGIGAVGPRLLYPDGRIQQAGVILGAGLHGIAEVAHRGLPKGDQGSFGRAALAQELSAVGAACMLVRRSLYLEVGGFDEEHLKVAFNDIDFCLKLLERGYRVIYTPYVELCHLEHASRGFENTTSKHQRFTEEIEYMKEKWCDRLLSDPAYNPNLSLGQDLFTLSFPPRVIIPWRRVAGEG